MTITHRGVTVETVPETGWAVAYRPDGDATVFIAPDLPAFASPQHRTAWLDQMAYGVDGYCGHCHTPHPHHLLPRVEGVAPIAATPKGAAHDPLCPCSPAQLAEQLQAEAPLPGEPCSAALNSDSQELLIGHVAHLQARLWRHPTTS